MGSDTVDFLMSQRNGAQYIVLYQMLCLMCINTNGALSSQIGEIIMPFDVDKIQRDCKYFSWDTITVALELFKKLGLIYEQDTGCLFISGFDSIVGYETDYAVQKRNQRKTGISIGKAADRETLVLETSGRELQGLCLDNNVDNVHTDVTQTDGGNLDGQETDSNVDIVHTEIRDKSKEKDKRYMTVSYETVCQTDVQRIVEAWNGLQAYGIKPVVRIGNPSKRYSSLMARIREYGIDNILKAIGSIKDSDFLRGRNKHGWVITFDWFVLPSNFLKVLEGNYENQPESCSINAPGGWGGGLNDSQRQRIHELVEESARREEDGDMGLPEVRY